MAKSDADTLGDEKLTSSNANSVNSKREAVAVERIHTRTIYNGSDLPAKRGMSDPHRTIKYKDLSQSHQCCLEHHP